MNPVDAERIQNGSEVVDRRLDPASPVATVELPKPR